MFESEQVHADEDEPFPSNDQREDQVRNPPSLSGSMQAEAHRRISYLSITDQRRISDLQIWELAGLPTKLLLVGGGLSKPETLLS